MCQYIQIFVRVFRYLKNWAVVLETHEIVYLHQGEVIVFKSVEWRSTSFLYYFQILRTYGFTLYLRNLHINCLLHLIIPFVCLSMSIYFECVSNKINIINGYACKWCLQCNVNYIIITINANKAHPLIHPLFLTLLHPILL